MCEMLGEVVQPQRQTLEASGDDGLREKGRKSKQGHVPSRVKIRKREVVHKCVCVLRAVP